MKKIVLTGGGSAGHVVPNLALADELSDFELAYIGTDGIEKSLVTNRHIPYYTIRCPKLRRSFSLQNCKIPWELAHAVKKARSGLRLMQTDLVFSKGGYVALPVVLAAKRLGIPVISHESDLSVGLANRIGANYSRTVLTAFPETAEKLKNGKYTGNPVRRELFEGDRRSARQKYGLHGDLPVVLVFGGGSGSAAINAALRQNVSALTRTCQILHICGKGNVVGSNLKRYVQLEYEQDMASAYAAADLVVSRAGANTVFELLALRKKSLLIPLCHASRGDQIENAEYFRKKGLCRVLQEEALPSLPAAVFEAIADRETEDNLSRHTVPIGNKAIVAEIRKALQPT